jgi:hypothetical protein
MLHDEEMGQAVPEKVECLCFFCPEQAGYSDTYPY